MNSSLRKFEARALFENFDLWLDQKLCTDTLTVQWYAQGAIEIYHNHTLLSDQSQGQALIPHHTTNLISISSHGHRIDTFYIDLFDCVPMLNFSGGSASLEFTKPFVRWYNDLVGPNRPSRVLSDRVMYDQQAEHTVQEILAKLPQLKY